MSRGFKICLWVLGLYTLFMSPLIWQGIKDGSVAIAPLAVYLGILAAWLPRLKNGRRRS